MAKRKKTTPATVNQHNGGIYIGDSARIDLDGDLVGRDKYVLGREGRELDALFARLVSVIQDNPTLNADEKREAMATTEELKAELKKPEPDLGKLNSLKKLLVSKGATIAAAVGALFQYPPVQDVIKTVAQRLIGG